MFNFVQGHVTTLKNLAFTFVNSCNYNSVFFYSFVIWTIIGGSSMIRVES